MLSLSLYAIVASVGVCHNKRVALQWPSTTRRVSPSSGDVVLQSIYKAENDLFCCTTMVLLYVFEDL